MIEPIIDAMPLLIRSRFFQDTALSSPEALHGFLTAIACGPNQLAADWLYAVGVLKHQRIFTTEDSEALIIVLRQAHGVICQQLEWGDFDPFALFSVIPKTNVKEICRAVQSWVQGFLRAVYLDIDAWLSRDSSTLVALLEPLVSWSHVAITSAAEAQLQQSMLRLALQQLPVIVLAIYAYWQQNVTSNIREMMLGEQPILAVHDVSYTLH